MSEEKEKEGDQTDKGAKGPFPTLSRIDSVEAIGTRIGPYELLSVLGEGGFGIVYQAEQKRPIRRQVALKVIKPGMDSKQVIARFESERQALALLDHPNIARVYDGGATETGRPYFAMELVRGLPITEYCDKHKLSIEERLELFQQVCEAVQHAHQKGIIHRDIKPSNILVPVRGEKPVPMIIDFGVAKAISQPLTERTLFTEQGQFIGTPEYMSPEQAGMTIENVDTRSDIYSLGVVLYELLTGTLPFSHDELGRAGFAEIQRIIRETDPPRPSTRLSSLGDEAKKVAEKRHTEAAALTRRLHNELEWIPLKAMRKEPDRRYKTASELADDVRKYLNGDPLTAGPESATYRAKKFIRKHRTKAGVAVLAGVLIVAIVVIFIMQSRAANRSREAESLRHTSTLSRARELHSTGEFQRSLSEVQKVLHSEYVGPEARLLHAQLTLELQGPAGALKELESLLEEREDIAGQAHFLLARIYYENDPDAPGRTATYRSKWEYHREKAEELLPETADAYLLRAVSAGTVPKALQYIDKALELDKNHYDSLRMRSSLSYASRDYHKMIKDAAQMTAIEPNNPQGYSLCGVAERELGQFEAAVEDHNKAISIAPNDPELYNQRWQTYMRMGKYEQALSDANMCVQLQPVDASYHHHTFYALVALGRYDEARMEHDIVVGSDPARKRLFDLSAAKYVSDVLDAGLSWHPRGQKPQGNIFGGMHEAERIYHHLAAKGRRIVSEGFHATWSPDGTELAYSYGTVGYSGIAILNFKSQKIRLLTTTGKDPEWSPNGEYIAYVRDRDILPLGYLIAGHEGGHRIDEEVWVVTANGSEEPRFLSAGRWPQWTKDSERIIFHSREGLRSVSIKDDGKPIHVISYSDLFGVSPEDLYIAYTEGNRLQIEDPSTGSVTTCWRAPSTFPFGSMVSWSPDARKISLPYYEVPGRWAYDQMGLWVYDLTSRNASKILTGAFEKCSWSKPDMNRMAIGRAFSTMYSEIWVADTAALDQGRTLREHFQEMADCCSRRIEADPSDTANYLSHARYCALLKEEGKALADLERCTTVNPSRAGQMYFEIAWRLLFDSGSQGDPDIAAHLARMAVEKEPNKWYYHMTLGVAQYYARLHEKSLTSFKEAENIYVAGGQRPYRYSFLDRSDQLADSTTLYYHPNAACTAMALHELRRNQEAEVALARLRRMFESDKNPEMLEYLIEAEQLFAGKDSHISVAWDCVRNRRFREALDLAVNMPASDSNPAPSAVTSVNYLRRFIARASLELGAGREQAREYGKAVPSYELTTRADPNYALAFNDLAWLQATCPKEDVRNGVHAIKNATKACELTKWQNGNYIDTLAAAYAEAGDFDSAVKRQQEAIDLLARNQQRSRKLLEAEARLRLYRLREPYHRQLLFTKKLLAHWTFNGDVKDSSGYENHGSKNGDPTYTAGKIGQAIRFDGDGDRIEVPATVAGNTELYPSEALSVSAWVRTTMSAGIFSSVIRHEFHFTPLQTHTTGAWAVVFTDQNGSRTLRSTSFDWSLINDGSWHHYAVMYDNGIHEIWIDGARTASSDYGSFPLWTRQDQPWVFGGRERAEGGGEYYTGELDDVRIYNYALSEEEIKALRDGTSQRVEAAQPAGKP